MDNPAPQNIDEYIAAFQEPTRSMLAQLRQAIREAAPQAGEKISYRIPTFTFHGNLVHFAGYVHHIGLYPSSSGIEAFKAELSAYKTSKGTVQFPLDEPLPLDLVRRIVAYRLEENRARAEATRRSAAASAAKGVR